MDDPQQARRFIHDICRGMETRAGWPYMHGDKTYPPVDEPTPQKVHYGDAWTFFYGIRHGVSLMLGGKRVEHDWDTGEDIDHGAGDREWSEHYEEFGYGAHGRGLKIGKRLAFYEDRDFEFHVPEETESEFTFTNSSESKFTFTE